MPLGETRLGKQVNFSSVSCMGSFMSGIAAELTDCPNHNSSENKNKCSFSGLLATLATLTFLLMGLDVIKKISATADVYSQYYHTIKSGATPVL